MAWLVTGLLAYMLLFQGAVSAYARSSMAADQLGSGIIICAPGGSDPQIGHPLAGLAHDCCSSLCQLACSIGPAAAPVSDLIIPGLLPLDLAHPQLIITRTAPNELGLSRDARAPPPFSIERS